MTSMKSTSQTRLVKNKYKLDCEPFQMSQFEWRGTLNESELIVIIKYNLGAWKVKIAETEYELHDVDYIYAAQETRPMKNILNKAINVNVLLKYLKWK